MQALADRVALEDLVSRLGRWLDEEGAEDDAAILSEDVSVDTAGGSARGRQAVVEQARRTHDRWRTQHIITNVLVEPDVDRARMQANLVVAFAGDPEAPEPVVLLGERYRFAAVRTEAGWRLSRIEVTPVWSTGELDR